MSDCYIPITVDNRPPLSPRQAETLGFIEVYLDEYGVAPSLREIADALGIKSTNGVLDHVRALERKGYVERLGDGRKRARALRVVGSDGEGGQLRRLRVELDQARADVALWESRAREAGWSEAGARRTA